MKKNTWNVLFVLLGLLAAAAGLWLLRGGADVESAYCGAHFRELLPAAMAYAAEYTRSQLAASMAGGSRPAENGLTGSGAVKLGSSVAALSPSDYARLCRLVEQGHRVSFG